MTVIAASTANRTAICLSVKSTVRKTALKSIPRRVTAAGRSKPAVRTPTGSLISTILANNRYDSLPGGTERAAREVFCLRPRRSRVPEPT